MCGQSYPCKSAVCIAARDETRRGGGLLQDRYKTHVYCVACETYHRREVARLPGRKRLTCPCCHRCVRTRPKAGQIGKEKYQRRKAARKMMMEAMTINNENTR